MSKTLTKATSSANPVNLQEKFAPAEILLPMCKSAFCLETLHKELIQ